MYFSKKIGQWYQTNKRDLPFRKTPINAYNIWVSEIILQQTKLEQGLPYYIKFIDKYPNIEALAAANEQDVLILWQGLGYYSRARNMHFTAKYICNKLKGEFPQNYMEILKLKGIGPYTAAAISSIAFKEPVVALDGNGYRFLSRYFGIEACIDESEGKKAVAEKGQLHIPDVNPGDFNQAIIEIGALLCKPTKPVCNECPVQVTCQAHKHQLIDFLPVRKRKSKPKIKYLYYFFIQDKHGKLLLKKRNESGIWRNLFEFPLLYSEKRISLKSVPESDYWKRVFHSAEPTILSISKEYKHVLSHQILKTRFFEVKVETHKNMDKKFIKIKLSDIDKYPIPKLIDKFFQQKELAS